MFAIRRPFSIEVIVSVQDECPLFRVKRCPLIGGFLSMVYREEALGIYIAHCAL